MEAEGATLTLGAFGASQMTIRQISEPSVVPRVLSSLRGETLISVAFKFAPGGAAISLLQVLTSKEVLLISTCELFKPKHSTLSLQAFSELESLLGGDTLVLAFEFKKASEALALAREASGRPPLERAFPQLVDIKQVWPARGGLKAYASAFLLSEPPKVPSKPDWAKFPLPPTLAAYAAIEVLALPSLARKLIAENRKFRDAPLPGPTLQRIEAFPSFRLQIIESSQGNLSDESLEDLKSFLRDLDLRTSPQGTKIKPKTGQKEANKGPGRGSPIKTVEKLKRPGPSESPLKVEEVTPEMIAHHLAKESPFKMREEYKIDNKNFNFRKVRPERNLSDYTDSLIEELG